MNTRPRPPPLPFSFPPAPVQYFNLSHVLEPDHLRTMAGLKSLDWKPLATRGRPSILITHTTDRDERTELVAPGMLRLGMIR
jgi:hypothetical protein